MIFLPHEAEPAFGGPSEQLANGGVLGLLKDHIHLASQGMSLGGESL